MSYYYNYYIGYRNKTDGQFYPLGPYDSFGKFKTVICRSRSFASDLHDDFHYINDTEVSKELLDTLGYEDMSGAMKFEGKYLPLNELPSDNYIESGYFLLSDIEEYFKTDGDTEDIFYEKLTPIAYALKLKNEITFGPPKQEFDCEGNPLEVHSCGDYGYFSYPDYHSKAYEVNRIKQAIEMLNDYDLPKDIEIVVLETEG